MNNCLVCHKIVEKDRRYSPYFYDFCSKCYEHFTRRVQRHAQRARKIGTYTKLSPSEVIQLIREQNFSCKYCKETVKLSGEGNENYLSIDHEYPLSHGGMNHISNVIILCRRCHDKKDNGNNKHCSPWNSGFKTESASKFSFGTLGSVTAELQTYIKTYKQI